MIAPEIIDAMIAAGATAEVIAAAWKADLASEQAKVDMRRANDAERQRRHRMSRDVTVTECDERDTPSPLTPPLKVSPDPFKITPPISPQPTPVGEAVEAWNATAEHLGLAKVKGVAGKRLSALKARLGEHGLDGFREALAAIERSPFCRGEKTDWRADIDFMVKPGNFQKLREGGYDPPKTAPTRSAEAVSYLDHVLAEKQRRESWERQAGAAR